MGCLCQPLQAPRVRYMAFLGYDTVCGQYVFHFCDTGFERALSVQIDFTIPQFFSKHIDFV